eukprot:6040732-Prymnesium_polylepis.1
MKIRSISTGMGTPSTGIRPWVKYLAKRAYKHDPRFCQHVEFGYHMSGHNTITQSVEHSTNLFDRN